METWLTLWTGLLFVSLGVFAVIAVVVAIGGFFDLKAMFKALKK